MTSAEKIAEIYEVLAAGRTVYIRTMTKATKVTQKNVRDFEAIGRPLFKADAKSLYISNGKRYDCIDYCTITVARGEAE